MNVVVFVTCANKDEAEKIATALVGDKLAACVNMINNVKSIFWWEGNLDAAEEVLLIIKSQKSLMAKIIKLVKSLHSYDLPEIIALPIVAGEKKYLSWLNESVGK